MMSRDFNKFCVLASKINQHAEVQKKYLNHFIFFLFLDDLAGSDVTDSSDDDDTTSNANNVNKNDDDDEDELEIGSSSDDEISQDSMAKFMEKKNLAEIAKKKAELKEHSTKAEKGKKEEMKVKPDKKGSKKETEKGKKKEVNTKDSKVKDVKQKKGKVVEEKESSDEEVDDEGIDDEDIDEFDMETFDMDASDSDDDGLLHTAPEDLEVRLIPHIYIFLILGLLFNFHCKDQILRVIQM